MHQLTTSQSTSLVDAAKARALMQSAIDNAYENHTVEEVMRAVAAGDATLMLGDASLLVMNLIEHNGEKTCHVWLGAGDKTEMIGPLRNKAEAWAREQGCKYATIEGRPGWVRALPDYQQVSVTVRKEL